MVSKLLHLSLIIIIFCGLWISDRAVGKMLQWSSDSPSSTRQPVAALKPPAAVHGAEENKSFKAEALLSALLVRGGADVGRGRHHVYLIQLGSLRGLPWDVPGKEWSCRPVEQRRWAQPSALHWIHLISQLSECWSSQTASLPAWGVGTDLLNLHLTGKRRHDEIKFFFFFLDF